MKDFIVQNWQWLAGSLILLAEDCIARSPLKANSTFQLVGQLLEFVGKRLAPSPAPAPEVKP